MESKAVELKKTDADSIYLNYFKEMPCFVSIQDREMRIRDCNLLFEKSFGAQVGAHCWEVYKGRMSKCQDCPVEKTFQTGEPQQSEEVVTNLKGEDVPVNVYTSPILDENGEVECVLEICTDISKVKKIQRKLHKTQQRLQQFFDEVPCYVTIQDRELKITAANRRFKEDFGEGVGAHCYEAYKHRDEPCLECPVARTFEEGQSHQSEEVVTAMSGDQYNVLVSTAPLRNAEGEIIEVLEISTNITQVRQLQDQLTSLGLLVSSISHSIKGLTSGLDSGMYLIGSGLEKDDRERIDKGWDIVQRNVSRIRSMILDILYYAKDRELQYETADVLEFVSDIASTMEGKVSNFNVDFRHDFAPSLGEFTVDHTAIRSALINVLENSFEACRRDLNKPSHLVTFRVQEDQTQTHILFDVTDNGIGMDRETQEKIFSLFFSSKGIEGTGLGLFISNKIFKKHGGSIEVSSALREGSHFRMIIPKRPELIGA
jgi:PAS domain S-box-containing protein